MHPSLGKEEKDYKTTTSIDLDLMESIQKEEAMIQINTLSSDKQFGEGTFKMSDIKKMTATKSFLGMPVEAKRCQVEPYEECRTKALEKTCNCVPWEILGIQVGSNHQINFLLKDDFY